MSMICVNGCKECTGCMNCMEYSEKHQHCPVCGHILDCDDIVYRVRENDEITGCQHCTESILAEEVSNELY